MKKKVLLIANYYEEKGGISASVENLYITLKSNYEVSIFSLGHKIKLFRIPKYIKLILLIQNYNIIHCHGSSYLGFIPVFFSAIIAFFFRKKVLITYHGAIDKQKFIKNSVYLKVIKKNIIAVTTPSKTTVKFFKDFEFKSFFIPNIVNENKWIFKDRKTIHPKVVCTRANYNTKKLINIYFELKKQYKELEFTLIGEIKNIELIDRILGIDGIKYKGQIKRNIVSNELRKSDIYLNLLSIDSFGYSIYEAMSCGLAIVSVKAKAFDQYSNAINFSKQDNVFSVVQTIADVIKNQDRSIDKIFKGIKAVENLSSEKIYFIWNKLYSDLM